MMRTRRWCLAAALGAGALVTACGGGSGDSDVATISGDGASDNSEESEQATEEELLDYVECLRDQGLDVADPTVDEDGNVVLGGPGGPGGGPGGGQQDGEGRDESAEPEVDREEFEKAQEACGEPPQGVGPSFDEEDQQAFQDASLAFAECMREQGVDFPDPDFSEQPQGGGQGGPGGGSDDGEGAQGGPFGDLDLDDPEIQAAMEECQDVFADSGVDVPGGGAAGGPPAGESP